MPGCWVLQCTKSFIQSHLELHDCCLVFLMGIWEAEGCNPVEIKVTFRFRNTFPSGMKRLWMWQMVFRFWERLGGSWCKFYSHNCLSLPSWKPWQHCTSKTALTRIENYLIEELRWCSGQTLQGVCPNGECLNTMGSYRCTCKMGFVPDPTLSRCIGK